MCTVCRYSKQNESEHESDGDDSETTKLQAMRFGTELRAPERRDGHLLPPGAQVQVSHVHICACILYIACIVQHDAMCIETRIADSGVACFHHSLQPEGSAPAAHDLLLSMDDSEAASTAADLPERLRQQLLHEERDVFGDAAEGHGNQDIFDFLAGQRGPVMSATEMTTKAQPTGTTSTTSTTAHAAPPDSLI